MEFLFCGMESKDCVIREMIQMIEREEKNNEYFIRDKHEYKWIIGEKIANRIFPIHPTRILDFEVVYEKRDIFDPNSISLIIPKRLNVDKSCKNCRYGENCQYTQACKHIIHYNPSHWVKMTEAQKFEKITSEINPNKKLVGDISGGYRYVDTDVAERIEESKRRAKEMDILDAMKYPLFETDYITNIIKDSMTNYNEMYIKKEDKKMVDLKIYMSGMFTGGIVTNPKDLIEDVIFSGPCTIIKWTDGDKTIVRCENEDFDKEKGLAMAICKKFFGTNESKSNYNDIFKKWIENEKKEEDKKENKKKTTKYYTVKTYSEKFGIPESSVRRMCRCGVVNACKQDGAWIIDITE